MNQKGITLIELMVVLIIIGILGMIGGLGVTSILENSRERAVLSEAQTITAAAELACLESCEYEDDKIIMEGYYDGEAVIDILKWDGVEYEMTFTFIGYKFVGTVEDHTITEEE